MASRGATRPEFREADAPRLRIHAVPAAGRRAHQGAAVAERSAAVPQPRQHDVRGRELGDGRLRRARRSHDREPAGRAGDDRDLRQLDRSLRRRRLPHRHRAARECGVLAGIRAGDAAAGGRARAFRTFTSSAKSRLRKSTSRCWPATRATRSCPRCSTSRSRTRCARQSRAMRAPTSWRGCLPTTRYTRAASGRRCNCRHSSAITTADASGSTCARRARRRATMKC